MVEVKYSGGLGENFFQYALGRSLAERWGLALRALPLSGFPNTRQTVNGETFLMPKQIWTGVTLTDWQTGQQLCNTTLDDPPESKIVLNGWFQRVSYIEKDLHKIRSWFSPGCSVPLRSSDEIGICVTFGTRSRWQLADDYHLMSYPPPRTNLPTPADLNRFVARIAAKKIWIITDQPENKSFFQNIEFDYQVCSGGERENLRFARSLTKLAFSWTAYDWWVSILSNADECWSLATPKPSELDPSRIANENLSAYADLRCNDPRFVYNL